MERALQLQQQNINAHLIDIDDLVVTKSHEAFFRSTHLIINIPSKNIQGYTTLLNIISKSQIKHVLLVSSTSVYKNINKRINERDHQALNDSPLLTIENLFIDNNALKTTVIRFGGLIGNGRNPARFFQAGKIIKDPHAFVNLIHHDDCIALITTIIKRNVWGEVFNACADHHPTKAHFYTEASRQAGLALPKIDESAQRPSKVIDNHKIKQHLNYTFIYPDPIAMLNDIKKDAT